MASLVPYASRGRVLATYPVKYNKYVALGQFAWQNRKAIASGARSMYRFAGRVKRRRMAASAMRKRRNYAKRRRIMRTIGERPGQSTAKKNVQVLDSTTAGYNTRTLWSDDVSQLTKQGTLDEIDYRNRDIANLRGLKFCWELRNDNATPMHFNMAVISPKNDKVTTISNTDFFRDWTNTRARDFSTTLSSNDFRCRPINKDIYDIICHKRYTLGGANEQATNASFSSARSNYRTIDFYIKINRQFRYDGTSTSAEGRRIFVVFWGDLWGNNSGAGGTNNIWLNRRTILYFREPKN